MCVSNSNSILINSSLRKSQRGVALVLVLFLSAIMILLATNVLKQSQSQLSQSQLVKDKVSAFASGYSTKSEIIFELLTQEPKALVKERNWDFSGAVMDFGNTKVQIQDLNGLLNIYNFVSHKTLANVFSQCGVDGNKAVGVAQKVLADHNKNMSLPIDKYQRLFTLLNDVPLSVKSCIDRNITRFSGAIFNPSTAQREYLIAKLGNVRAQKVLTAKENSREALQQAIADISPDDPESNQRSIIGPYFRVTLRAHKDDSNWSEMFEIKIANRIVKKPLTYLGYSPL
ncbi:hypothetical protein [Litorilituus lipolyticus]|uniref:General secretion pathway protein GspK n=1 Tax=Litorilituus lipolyticus TaxID=2491017 RepID=A0A502L9L8_9GAMM|nr:hypothetical protein [Litorilituus lipolyticus]TPH18971.1 hypothetical protein EPA86_01355 [Litorilituus lipolyticus]